MHIPKHTHAHIQQNIPSHYIRLFVNLNIFYIKYIHFIVKI